VDFEFTRTPRTVDPSVVPVATKSEPAASKPKPKPERKPAAPARHASPQSADAVRPGF